MRDSHRPFGGLRVRPDLLSIVETSYDLGGDTASWLNRLVGCARSSLDSGLGIAGLVLDATDAFPQVPKVLAAASAGLSDAALQAIGGLLQISATDEIRMRFHRAGPAGFVRSTLGRSFRGDFRKVHESAAEDSAYLFAGDPAGVCCVLFWPRSSRSTMYRSQKATYAYLAAHIATAHRLRQRAPTTAPDAPDTEAIMNPSGAVVHADGDAKKTDARANLRDAVVSMMRARGARRRRDAAGALEDWRALVSGRWSLVDHFDTDGRRFLVARRNAPNAPAIGGLSEREGCVARLAALGHPNKVIAYELGMSSRQAAADLATAMAALGARSRFDLIRILTPVKQQ